MGDALFKFAFCLAGTEDQDRLCRTDMGNDQVVKFVELFVKFIVQLIISLLMLGAAI